MVLLVRQHTIIQHFTEFAQVYKFSRMYVYIQFTAYYDAFIAYSYEIMLDCWLEDPTQRPTFTALRSKFDAMLAEDNPYIQFDNINIHKPYYHRNTNSDSDDTKTESISGSAENGMDSSYTSSSVTLSGTGANAYDTLSPITDEVASSIEESLKRPVPNMYVETPSKPYDSMFDLDSAGMEQIVEADCESCCSSSSCETDLCETAV